MAEKTKAGAAGWEGRIRMAPAVLLAEAALSPLEVARARASGRLEVEGLPGGRSMLVAGGVAVASGRMVMRGGKAYFKVGRLLTAIGGEEA